MDDQLRVIEALATSRIFNDYAAAFCAVTGVRLCLEADAPEPSAKNIITSVSDIIRFPGGIYKAVIVVRDGARVFALLRTGFVVDDKPASKKHPRASGLPLIPERNFAPLLKLLSIFAEQLGMIANQLLLQQTHCEPGAVLKARRFIRAHYRELIDLETVARHAHVSSFHLCKIFKHSTGINFTNYIARVRLEAARELLHKRNFRINEIALESGFRSLAHFNRVFKRFVGESPRAYRRHLPRLETCVSSSALR